MELKDKITEILREDVPRLFTIIRWDGMYNNTVKKIMKVIKEYDETN